MEREQIELPYHVRLDQFEGPLDLLLHLIKKHEINIYDIPISLITQQYLEYVELDDLVESDGRGGFSRHGGHARPYQVTHAAAGR